jgi:hypothetical protein
MSQQVKHPAVQIDNRLSELFVSRRSNAAASESQDMEVEDPSSSYETSWLQHFEISADKEDFSQHDVNNGASGLVTIVKSQLRPFWRPKDAKLIKGLWMKSKSALSKDSQKQRKAALRKTSVR